MKWPTQLTFVRHAESEYNVLRAKKEQDPLYQTFLAEYNSQHNPDYVKGLAREVERKFSLQCSDRDTKITANGKRMAYLTGQALPEEINLPDVVFVSPYLRAVHTYEQLCWAWPQLKQIKFYFDERLRELDHGLSLLYNDWRVFFTFHPEQRRLRELLGEYDYRYPNGENVPDVRMRVRDWRSTVIREFHDRNVLVISHHITLLSFRADQERLSPQEYKRLDKEEKPINCGVTIYDGIPDKGRQGRLALSCYNRRLYND
jgi:broad specificity phosphatase PhoE